jgi:hypothetical protein
MKDMKYRWPGLLHDLHFLRGEVKINSYSNIANYCRSEYITAENPLAERAPH